MLLTFLLFTPLITGILCGFLSQKKALDGLNIMGAGTVLILGLSVFQKVLIRGVVTGSENPGVSFLVLRVDALSTMLILIISILGFLTAVYSVGYMGQEIEENLMDLRKLRRYYLLFHLFIFTMLLVCMTDNLGILWIAIEATTLASAFLVAFYGNEHALEAAWKYIILCTVGIAFALFGTIFIYLASINLLDTAEPMEYALNWSYLTQVASKLDPKFMKLAFLFILVGYGTKAGLAPLHAWLPDAHSQAPTPISALLSGVLLNCALYGLIRFHILISQSVGPDFSSRLLLLFGIFSLALATPFILVQNNYKRLLAYSSIEHMGIITTGLGFTSALGIYGAILHLFNHAVTKALMFLTLGNVRLKYRTTKIDKLRGGLRHVMPVTGPLLLIGALGLAGAPPFSIFLSEFTILSAGFVYREGPGRISLIFSLLLLSFITCIFAGLMYHVAKMAFGTPPEKVVRGEGSLWTLIPLGVLVLFIGFMGFHIPKCLHTMILKTVEVVKGPDILRILPQ